MGGADFSLLKYWDRLECRRIWDLTPLLKVLAASLVVLITPVLSLFDMVVVGLKGCPTPRVKLLRR